MIATKTIYTAIILFSRSADTVNSTNFVEEYGALSRLFKDRDVEVADEFSRRAQPNAYAIYANGTRMLVELENRRYEHLKALLEQTITAAGVDGWNPAPQRIGVKKVAFELGRQK